MSFPKYPAYKDSGVEWIGEIPVGWIISPLRYLAHCLDGKRIPLNKEERSYKKGDIPYWGANCIVDFVDEFLFNQELILLGEDGAPFFDKTKEVSFYINEPIWPNNHVHVLKVFENFSPKFLVYSLNCVEYSSYIEGSTRDKLTQNNMNRIVVPIPPLPEQQAIASFLDRECGKIDALIAEQERLIALLAEKRQAVISHAVTKGLNPNAPMKDSGIPWIGMVPEGWEIRPIKMIAEIFGRIGYRGYTSADIVDETIGVISLSPSNMNNGKVYFDEKNTYITKEKYEESPEIKISPNDILLVKTGSTIGKVAYVYEQDFIESTINPQIVVFKKIKIDKKFLFFVMSTNFMRSVFEIGNVGGTIPTMSQSYISNLRIAIPTMSEQKMISNSLSEQERKFRSEREYTLKIISLLKERRAALISAAVTGKIDVRAQSEALAA